MTDNTEYPNVHLLAWEAWAPGLCNREAWCRWLPEGGPVGLVEAKPACKDVPPMLRRRYSLPSRMMLEVSLAVCRAADVSPREVHLLFGSANGEIATLKRLLEDLSEDSPLSPTAFSNSVHHVPTGHFGMVTRHQTVSRTLSSFEDTFACGFLEMVCLLRRLPQSPVLLVLADEIPPEPFDQMLAVPPFPYAVAMLFSVDGPSDVAALAFRRQDRTVSATSRLHGEPVFDFLRWYEGGAPDLRMNTSFGVVSWNR